MREGSAPNFCPPVEEGISFTFEDEHGDLVNLEFLGLIIHGDRRYGFFLPCACENCDEDCQELEDNGEVILLEVTALDEEGQPEEFELVVDEAVAQEVFEDFKNATKDLYDFA